MDHIFFAQPSNENSKWDNIFKKPWNKREPGSRVLSFKNVRKTLIVSVSVRAMSLYKIWFGKMYAKHVLHHEKIGMTICYTKVNRALRFHDLLVLRRTVYKISTVCEVLKQKRCSKTLLIFHYLPFRWALTAKYALHTLDNHVLQVSKVGCAEDAIFGRASWAM